MTEIKHALSALFDYQISHDEDSVSIEIFLEKESHNYDLTYEDEDFLINKELILKAINYLQLKEDVKFSLSRKPSLSSKLIIKEEDKNLINTKSFSPERLIYPFFSKLDFPAEFKIKDYQSEGISWLNQEKGRLLADDMGLGKTMQAILAATSLIKSGQSKSALIICPRSLMYNWQQEIKLWAPSFTSLLISNITKSSDVWDKVYGKSHFYITNYDHIRKLPNCLKENPPSILIADEAHKLRKSTSIINKNLSKIKAERFWALTGTPIERDTEDLATILKLVKPSFTSSLKKLSPSAIRAVSKKHTLRRVKKDVLKSLKKKNNQTYYLSLTEQQSKAYLKTKQKMSSGKDNLKFFGELMSICNELDEHSSKLDFAEELIEKITLSEEKVVVFSYSISPLHSLKTRLNNTYNEEFSQIYEGSMDSKQRNLAIKIFQNDEKVRCLLCSGKIAGEGLNLTEANHVIFINEWWNPSSNRQAEDRVLRIGQSKEVNIYHLRCKFTVEERLDEIIQGKIQLTNDVVENLVKQADN